MKLRRLEIHNYKSLRHVVLEPTPLSVFVGPNAAGKSNLADALDFLGDVYRWDLEGAVKRKGGYENICFRQARPTERIKCRVVLEVEATYRRGRLRPLTGLVFDHTFKLGTRSGRGQGSFYVSYEELSIFSRLDDSDDELLVRLERSRNGFDAELPDHSREDVKEKSGVATEDELTTLMGALVQDGDESSLFFGSLRVAFPWVSAFSKGMSALRVFQLSPRDCREAAVPTRNASLDRFGGNLPAVIDYLKNNEPDAFEGLVNAVRCVMPSLESIATDFTHTKTLALFLKEAGVERRWTAEDISDGTIQAIALLAATFDPRIPLLVLEEPENCVHPWAIRNFVQAFRDASETKQIFLTTHSPILIDQIRLEELWVVQRPALETKITPVLELDPTLEKAWGQGKFTLSEYLDSGALPAAVPAPGA